MSELFHLIKKIGVQRKYIFLLILRSPFDALRTWMLASLMKRVFFCVETGDTGTLFSTCIIYGLICALLFLYNGTIWSIYAAFSAKVETRLQKMMLDAILNLPFHQVDSRFSGEWLTRLNSDIQAAKTMMNAPMNIPHAVVAILNTILSSFLMMRSSVLLFAATWACLLPHLFLNYKIVLRHIPKLKEESQAALAKSTSAIRPLIAEADIILIYDAGDLMMRKCDESSHKLMKVNLSIHMRNAVNNAILRLFGSGGYLMILLAGYRFIRDGSMCFSDVVYCFQVRVSILAGMFLLLTCLNNIKANSVCINRINASLKEWKERCL